MSRSIKQIAEERARINNQIRAFFVSRGYVEVETPIMVASPGMEPNLVPFETTVIEPDGIRHAAGLITSPEYAMKKLLASGMEKIFTLTKVFRNGEELGGTHNPEFTMLEWYRQGADYHACMDETEALVKEVVGIDKEFRRARVAELFQEANIVIPSEVEGSLYTESLSDAFHRAFLEKIEPNLGKDPVFVYDYPTYQAALARLTSDKQYGERFELYIDGLELCNGFTELTDPDEQRRRFEEEAEERREQGKPVFPIDEELLAGLSSLRNPTYGNALGVDRLHMLAAKTNRIEDVLPFPAKNLF